MSSSVPENPATAESGWDVRTGGPGRADEALDPNDDPSGDTIYHSIRATGPCPRSARVSGLCAIVAQRLINMDRGQGDISEIDGKIYVNVWGNYQMNDSANSLVCGYLEGVRRQEGRGHTGARG